jgi:hypothetical protein
MKRSSHETRGSIGSRQRTIHQCLTRGAGRHPQGRNAVEQPRTARLDAAMGGEAPQGNVNYRFWHLTFHSRSFRGDPPHDGRFARRLAWRITKCAQLKLDQFVNISLGKPSLGPFSAPPQGRSAP